MQNIELRLPVKQSLHGQYESSRILQQVNDQSGQQCKFLCVHTALCGVVEHWQLGVWSQTGIVLGNIIGYKNITVCNTNDNLREAAKFQNSIFLHLQMPPPLQCRPGGCPLRPPAATGHVTENSSNIASLVTILNTISFSHCKVCQCIMGYTLCFKKTGPLKQVGITSSK